MSALSEIFNDTGKTAGTAPAPVAPQPAAPAPAPAPQTLGQKIGGFFSNMFSGSKPATPAPAPTPAPTPAPATSPLTDIFAAPKTSTSTSTPKTGSLTDIFAPKTAKPAGPVPSPYFYNKYPSGATIGASDQLDSSGKPLFAYRNPGDTSTTTDKTRIATTFDPTKAQPLTKEQYYNPRTAQLRETIGQELGIKPSEQLDHAIALTVGGSNQPENLRAIPTAENQAAGQVEGQLAQDLKDGKISYFDAQIKDAEAKGLKLPWTPGDTKAKENWIQQTWDKIKGLVVPDAHAATESKPSTLTDIFKPAPAPVKFSKPAVSFGPESPTNKTDSSTPSVGDGSGDLFSFIKNEFTPRTEAVPYRRVFEKEPIMTRMPPIVTQLASFGNQVLEAIPRLAATVGGEAIAHGQPTEVQSNIDLRRFGFDTPNYVTAAKEQQDAINSGENPWISGLRIMSNKTLDVAFGASLVANLMTSATEKLLAGGAEARIEAQNIVDASKQNMSEAMQRLKDSPIPEKEKVMAELANTKNQAQKVLSELGAPTKADKAKVAISRFTEMAGRETPMGPGYVDRMSQPDLGVKRPTPPPVKIAGQLPGYKPITPSPFPAGLSTQAVERVGGAVAAEDAADVATKDVAAKVEAATTPKQVQTIAEGESQVVPISKINVGEDEISAAKDVAQGKNSMSQLPVLVEPKPDGTYDIIDGKHRVAQTSRAGKTDFLAITDEKLYRKLAAKEESFQTRVTAHDRTGTGGVRSYVRTAKPTPFKYTPAEQKTIDAFGRSSGLEKVGSVGGQDLAIGTYGKNAIARKIALGKTDRLPASAIAETSKNIKESYIAGDSGFRKGNVVHIAEMPNGDNRAIVTRTNAKGQAEVINFFNVGRDVKAFTKNLESFGVPTGSRTQISSLEEKQSNPLTYRDKGTIQETAKKVKPEPAKLKTSDKLGYNRPVDEVRQILYKHIPKKDVQLIFSKDPIGMSVKGSYERSVNPNLAPIIRIMDKGGKANLFTGLHEAAHYMFDPENGIMSAAERDEMLSIAKKNMGFLKKVDKLMSGYKPSEMAEEYLADEWAKQKAADEGFHGPLKRALEMFNKVVQKVYDIYKKVRDSLDEMLPEKGRQGGYIGKSEDMNAEIRKKKGITENPRETLKNAEKRAGVKPVLPVKGKTPEIYNKFIEGDPTVEEELAREADDMNVINQKNATDLLDLEEKGHELEMRREALNNNPASQLAKYESKTGEFAGRLREVTGGPEAKSEFARRGDDIAGELGFKDSETAREAYEKYKSKKDKFQKDMQVFNDKKRELFQKFREDAIKHGDATTHEAGNYDTEITEANKGIVPPSVRGGIQAPEMDLTKLKDMGAARLGRDTMERNLEKVAGPYADELKDFLVEPVRTNEVDRIHYADQIRNEARTKLKDWGIKRRSNEADLIQRYGEGYLSIEELKKATPKWKEVSEAADYFRKVYDRLIGDWNIERAKFGYSAVPKRADYFRHFNDINQFTNSFGFLRSESQLPTEIAGMSHAFKPGKPFSTAELHRVGNMTSFDAIGGMDNYLDSVSKQMFHIDSVQRGRALEKYIRKVAKENRALKLPNFVQNVQEWTNLTSGKAAMLDRAIESTVGRPVMKFLSGLSKLVGRNIISGNISVALTHLVSLPLNLATVDKVPFTKALLHTLVSPLKAEPITMIDGIESSFLARRYPEKYILPTNFDKIDNTLGFLFHVTDIFKSKLAVASKFYENLNKGMDSAKAMSEADKYAGRIVGDYSTGNRPNLMSANVTKLVAQFQLGVNDGMSVLIHDIPAWEKGNKAKIAARLVAFMVFSYLFNQFYKEMRGSGKGLDPIGAGLTLAGMTDESAGQDFLTRLKLSATEVAGELPFTSIGFGSFPLATAVAQPFGQLLSGPDRLGAAKTLAADLISPVGGGGQAKKTIEGIQAFNAGQTTTGTGQMKTTIDKNPLNFVRGAVFGKTGFVESKAASDETTRLRGLLGQSQGSVTKQAEDLFAKMKAMPQADASKSFQDLMKSNPDMANRIREIAKEDKLGMTQNDRLIKQLNVSLGVRAKYIYSKLMALPDNKARSALWEDYKAKHIITPQVDTQIRALIKNGK